LAQDWIVFKLADDATGSGELSSEVVSRLKPPFDALLSEAKKVLGGERVPVSASPNGVRLSGATVEEVSKVAEALEAKLEASVGIAQVSTNEWWDRQDFEVSRAPLG
jgi:hypothetical protein